MKYKLINYYPPYTKKDIGKIVWFGLNNLLGPENYPEFWEKVVEKDYEILSYITINSEIIKYQDLDINDDCNCDKYLKIHSIKRLSDGEIFTIGDKINFNNMGIGKLLEIDFERAPIDKGKGILCFVNDNKTLGDWWNINQLSISRSLFTTEDGVDIFKSDTFYYVKFTQYDNTMGKPFEVVKGNHPTFEYEPQYEKYFSTKEKAEEYILLNKPCLSINDVAKVFVSINYTTDKGNIYPQGQKLRDLVKLKIQQSV